MRGRAAASALVAMLVGGLTLLGPAEAAYACSCGFVQDATLFDDADVVFIGTAAMSTQPDWDRQHWFMDVGMVLKGPKRNTAMINGGRLCDFPFERGHAYQVFAGWWKRELIAGLCGGTRDLASSTAFLPAAQFTPSPAAQEGDGSLVLLLGDIGMILVLIIAILFGPPLIARRRKRNERTHGEP